MNPSSSLVTKIGGPKIFLDPLTVLLSLYLIVYPPLSGVQGDDTAMRILAIIISIFCTTDMFMAWYVSDEAFNDPSLIQIKIGLTIFLNLVGRILIIPFWIIVAASHASVICWLITITIVADPLLFLVQFIQERVELVRTKQRSKDSANPESYDIEA